MAEYLAPGVYVEEFDSGIKAMEGVGTSTAGFLGMAQKGPVKGAPVLITSFADYQRRFGGYLSERVYGSLRFLPYAVEQFFTNGGSTCYVMRVCKTEGDQAAQPAKTALGQDQKEFLTIAAANPGEWGNHIQVRLLLNPKGKTALTKAPENTAWTALNTKKKDYETALTTDKQNQEKLMKAREELAKAEEEAAKETEAAKKEAAEQTVKAKKEAVKAEEDVAKTSAEAAVAAASALAAAEEACGYEADNVKAFRVGDLVCMMSDGSLPAKAFATVTDIKDNTIYLSAYLGEEENDTHVAASGSSSQPGTQTVNAAVKALCVAEWTIAVQDETVSEQFDNVSFNRDRSNYLINMLGKSQLAEFKAAPSNFTEGLLEEKLVSDDNGIYLDLTLSGGKDAGVEPGVVEADLYKGKDGAPGERTGLKSFQTISDVSIMAIPGITDQAVLTDLVAHCENMNDRFAILDMPEDDKEVADLLKYREMADTSYAAMYHPWIQCYDMLAKKNAYMPPSGAMAGIYARTDNTRGVHKAPANEIVKGCTGLSVRYNDAEQGKLNPKGVNLIRSLPGQGIRVWGARTCSSDGNWKYVNVRRLFIYIEQSIKVNTNWAVFEPNDEMLWSRVEGTIRVFLTTQWRNGALTGSTAEEAFFINIGNNTMTQDDILNGRLICVIGVAPVRPAEFVIFRITQKMETAQ